MAVRFQLVIDCANPDLLARFWAAALGYELEPPPDGFASWDDYWRDMGLPDEDLGIGEDRIVDPGGGGPRIWFQAVRNARRSRTGSISTSTPAAVAAFHSAPGGSLSTPRSGG